MKTWTITRNDSISTQYVDATSTAFSGGTIAPVPQITISIINVRTIAKIVNSSTESHHSIRYSFLSTKPTNQQVRPTIFCHFSPGIVSPVRSHANDSSAGLSLHQRPKPSWARNFRLNTSSLPVRQTKCYLRRQEFQKMVHISLPHFRHRHGMPIRHWYSSQRPLLPLFPILLTFQSSYSTKVATLTIIRYEKGQLICVLLQSLEQKLVEQRTNLRMLGCLIVMGMQTLQEIDQKHSHYKSIIFWDFSFHSHVVLIRIVVNLLRIKNNVVKLFNRNYQKLKIKQIIWQVVQC